MRHLKAVILALAIAVPAVCPMAVDAQPAPKTAVLSVDALVSYFDTIAFGSELDPKYASTVVAKWPKDVITVSLERGATPEYLGFVSAHLTVLGKLTGKKFGGTKTAETADIRILFVKREEMAAIRGPNVDAEAVLKGAMGGGCYFLFWKKPEKDIVKAIVVVNVERDPATTNSCLLEELTQSLGLPNDSDVLRPSIFSDRDHLTELAVQDQVLVRTLYDPRMTAGLPRAAALKVARTVISGLGKPAK